MQNIKDDQVRKVVRKTYAEAAKAGNSGCGGGATLEDVSAAIGYSPEEISSAPEGANLGLGCGNPQAIASLEAGQTVLDLGSGGGFDCFLAAKAVGPTGKVIGVDMTPEMLSKARQNAQKGGFDNVEFRLGEIEALPVADDSVDVIISNCVINLSPEKPRVFEEAFRALKPGGRLAISDIVATAELPEDVKNDLALFAGCVAGAAPIEDLDSALKKAGFTDVRIRPVESSREFIRKWTENTSIADYVVSATIEAIKP